MILFKSIINWIPRKFVGYVIYECIQVTEYVSESYGGELFLFNYKYQKVWNWGNSIFNVLWIDILKAFLRKDQVATSDIG